MPVTENIRWGLVGRGREVLRLGPASRPPCAFWNMCTA